MTAAHFVLRRNTGLEISNSTNVLISCGRKYLYVYTCKGLPILLNIYTLEPGWRQWHSPAFLGQPYLANLSGISSGLVDPSPCSLLTTQALLIVSVDLFLICSFRNPHSVCTNLHNGPTFLSFIFIFLLRFFSTTKCKNTLDAASFMM